MDRFPISIDDVVRLHDLEIDPKTVPGSVSYQVKCPFCGKAGSRQYKMNINREKNAYRCVRCLGDEKGLGVLDLHSRIVYGAPASKIGASKVYKDLAEQLHLPQNTVTKKVYEQKQMSYRLIYPAPDDYLHKAYTALLSLPYLSLSKEHRFNLMNRGLNLLTISANKYASINVDRWVMQHPDYKKTEKMYSEKKIYQEIQKYPKLKHQSKKSIIAGFLIAADIMKKGVSLKYVPGFFKLANIWCMKVNDGMLIPTRNEHSQIVGIQIRTDAEYKAGLRYLTLSSKDLDEGPNTDISRIHFPQGNADIRTAKFIGITEGPLKADIAVALLGVPVYMIALQGVNNIRSLPDIINLLKKSEVKDVWNMLDMDRFCNPYVQKAVNTIKNKLQEENISFKSMIWDKKKFKEHVKNIQETCNKSNIAVPEIKAYSEDEWMRSIFNAFAQKQIDIEEAYRTTTGKDFSWSPETKGIDDYLKNREKHQNDI